MKSSTAAAAATTDCSILKRKNSGDDDKGVKIRVIEDYGRDEVKIEYLEGPLKNTEVFASKK